MLGRMCRLFVWGTAFAVLSQSQLLHAQWYGGTNACAPCAAPNPCGQTVAIQPVVQTCYQTVPVTTYEPETKTVEVPETYTEWRDEEYTAYRPVVEQRTAQIPTVSYQNVTECKTVTRDLSYWRNRVEPVCKPSPCDYDNRPNMLGWLNRTGYSIRNTFTPKNRIRREYVPNVVSHNVPVTRQVAIRGTRQHTYNVTTMQPYKATRKVAVQKTRYVARKVTEMKARTVYKTIPSGTSIAYLPGGGAYGTATAFAPTPVADPFATRSADAEADRSRSARKEEPIRSRKSTKRRSSRNPRSSQINRRSNSTPTRSSNRDHEVNEEVAKLTVKPVFQQIKNRSKKRTAPSMVRVGRWVPSRTAKAKLEGPALDVAVAGTR